MDRRTELLLAGPTVKGEGIGNSPKTLLVSICVDSCDPWFRLSFRIVEPHGPDGSTTSSIGGELSSVPAASALATA